MYLIQNIMEAANYQLAKMNYLISPAVKKNPKRIVLVNGAPRTGTTWTVGMVSSVPGYHQVGNFQRDLERFKSIQPGDVIHGHEHFSEELKDILNGHDVRVILLLRDPRDQTVSRLFHTRRNQNHSWQAHLQTLSDDEGLMACIEGLDPKTFPGVASLATIPQSWLANYPKTILVKYEEMNANPETSLSGLFSQLEMDVPRNLLLSIIEHNSFQHMTVGRKFWQQGRKPGAEDPNAHVRKGIVGDWKNNFKPHHIQRFKELAGDILIEFGYEKDLSW